MNHTHVITWDYRHQGPLNEALTQTASDIMDVSMAIMAEQHHAALLPRNLVEPRTVISIEVMMTLRVRPEEVTL